MSNGALLKKIIIGATMAAFILLLVVLTRSTPSGVGPLGVLAVFCLLYLSALGVLTFLLHGLGKVSLGVRRLLGGKGEARAFTLRQSYYYGSIVALAPVMIIAMQSVGSVGIYQLLLIGLLVGIACFYVSKRTA